MDEDDTGMMLLIITSVTERWPSEAMAALSWADVVAMNAVRLAENVAESVLRA